MKARTGMRSFRVASAVLAIGGGSMLGVATTGGEVEAKCYSLGNGGYTQSTWARETPLTDTCNGDGNYDAFLMDRQWGDGIDAIFEARYTDDGSSWAWYGNTSESWDEDIRYVFVPDAEGGNNMQFRLCRSVGSCATAGTNYGH